MSSTLGAMFFIGNGFYIEHLIAGQIGYQLFPLGAVILYALTDRRSKYIYNGAIIATVITLMIFQAGFYLIVILILSLSITLPVLYLYKAKVLNLRNITLTAISAAVLCAAITASKIYAVAAFMSHFPRQIFDVYDIGLFQAGIGLIVQILGTMTLAPIFIATQNDPALLTGTFSSITGAGYGLWETDIGLSPVLIIFLFIGFAFTIAHLRKSTRINLNRSLLVGLILLAIPVWITIEMTLARGIVYTATKQFPILRSLHVNVRFAAAFLLPLIIVGTLQLHRFFLKNPKQSYFAAFTFLSIAALFSFFSLSREVHIREFNVRPSNIIHEKIQSGSRFPVTDIGDISPWVGFSEQASSIKPYEPIFGYKLEEFNHQIRFGSVFETENGYFNMTNPESFVFPEANDLDPFERFKVSERDKLETFLERRQPEWNIPMAQKILNKLSLIALIFTAGILITTKFAELMPAVKRKNTI
ncbi:MAG: hypothetical protein EHM33_19515 [Chloroflexi bacterium]|nr:MAG: hypothetical protein EHM33_19515 [Chloroflexota bacterium]